MIKLFFLSIITFSSFSQGSNASFNDYLSVYQKFVSNIRGGECQMYPSCSNFAMDAFKQKSPLTAFSITSDRLLRCSHDLKNYSLTFQNKGYKLVDFVNQSDNIRYINRFSQTLYAYSDTITDGSKSIKFIKYLVNKELYQQALLEINRVIFEKKEGSDINEIYTNYLICLRAINENEKALYDYEVMFPASVKENPKTILEVGNTWFGLKNYENSIKQYEKILNQEKKDSILIDEANMLKGISYAKQFQWNDAKSALVKVSQNGSYARNSTKNLLLIDKANTQKFKSPFVAGVLGIIPGGGYLYASHKQTALSSFVINSLFAYGAYTSYKTENFGIGILSTVIGLAFYIGNIQGSVKSAKRYNQAQKENISNRINLDFSY